MEESEVKANVDLYSVMGVGKECSSNHLKLAYKKLAMRWHPDRCSASGNSKSEEEAKNKFQAIQHAYSVLSDHNKRLLYDVGMYDEDDDTDTSGMGDFMGEMANMMSQTDTNEKRNETFEDLQQLFQDIFNPRTNSFAPSASSQAPRNGSSSSNNVQSGGTKRRYDELHF